MKYKIVKDAVNVVNYFLDKIISFIYTCHYSANLYSINYSKTDYYYLKI